LRVRSWSSQRRQVDRRRLRTSWRPKGWQVHGRRLRSTARTPRRPQRRKIQRRWRRSSWASPSQGSLHLHHKRLQVRQERTKLAHVLLLLLCCHRRSPIPRQLRSELLQPYESLVKSLRLLRDRLQLHRWKALQPGLHRLKPLHLRHHLLNRSVDTSRGPSAKRCGPDTHGGASAVRTSRSARSTASASCSQCCLGALDVI